jgi:hypothetical protein
MKSFKTIELSSTDLYKQLSFSEIKELEKVIYNRIQQLMTMDPKFREVDAIITQSFWIMKPQFIHFDYDIRIISESNNKLNYLDQFNGAITFFYTLDDFLLARELYYLQNYQSYIRNNVTV